MKPIRIPDPTEKKFDPLPVHPTGDYLGLLEKVEERPDKYNPGEWQYLWFWRLQNKGYENALVFQYTSAKMVSFRDRETNQLKMSNALKNLEALSDGELIPNTEIDLETQFYGKVAILSLLRTQRADGEWHNKVVNVQPLSAGAVTPSGPLSPMTSETPTTPVAPGAAELQVLATTPIETSGALPESLGYIRRFEVARKVLNWAPAQIIDTIVAVTGIHKAFHLLPVEQQRSVLEEMERLIDGDDFPF
jgi:hypothetical protein